MPPSPPARPRMPSISARGALRRSDAPPPPAAALPPAAAPRSPRPAQHRARGTAGAGFTRGRRGHRMLRSVRKVTGADHRRARPGTDKCRTQGRSARAGVRNRVKSGARRSFLLALCAIMYFSGRYQQLARFRGGGRRDRRRSTSSHERPRPDQARSNLMSRNLRTICAVLLARHHGRPCQAQTPEPTPLRFSLDGRVEGPSALFLVPLDRGYYKNEVARRDHRRCRQRVRADHPRRLRQP